MRGSENAFFSLDRLHIRRLGFIVPTQFVIDGREVVCSADGVRV
jgi:hypothetical protein